jgi:uncharacterized protein YjiK
MVKLIYSGVLFFALLFNFCSSELEDKSVRKIGFSLAVEIPVPEPSGLAISFNEKSFWVVSDENSTIYLIDGWGKVLKSFKVDGEDLEGIAVIDEKTIAIVLEKTREVVILDTFGSEVKRASINLEGELNSGLEGITYDSSVKKFYILNEKKPRLLLTLDENLTEIKRDTLNFSKDVSGIFFDGSDNILWILSDESQSINQTDLQGNPIQEYKIKITQPEGIALNKNRSRLYIVSDKSGKLYVFNLD